MPARLSGSLALPTLAAAAAFALLPLAAPAAPGADPGAGGGDLQQVEIESAKNSAGGIVNSNAVYVRCGPAESYYPTMKLDKGARVTVVGMKLDWLKIVPPDGSFCYISKAFVDRNGDGTAGKVNKDAVNVRAGSTLNSLKVVPLCQLSIGMDVKIIGEQDEYYKILPPDGKAFVYVNKQFVEPDPNAKPEPLAPPKDNTREVATKNEAGRKTVPPTKNPDKKTEGADDRTTGADDKTDGAAANAGSHPTTQPADGAVVAQAPTTQPSGEELAAAGAAFDKAEVTYTATVNKLDAKVIADLLKEYESLAAGGKLPSTLQRVAESRIATLKIRAANADELAKAQALQEQMHKKTVALQAERKELEEQIAEKSISVFTAVGELQASSLQIGAKTLFRLTDPANGRTVCYLRSDDGKILALLGKFIGVKGDITTESQLSLKVITPTQFAAVDPGKVGKGVTATVIPPSMIVVDEASTAAHLDARP